MEPHRLRGVLLVLMVPLLQQAAQQKGGGAGGLRDVKAGRAPRRGAWCTSTLQLRGLCLHLGVWRGDVWFPIAHPPAGDPDARGP